MISLKRTPTDIDFQKLVALLDRDLQTRDGDDHAFFAQFNKIDNIQHTVVAYIDQEPVGCGAIKKFDLTSVEIKRMYVMPQQRGKGVAGKILSELEKWSKELGYMKGVLETGLKQPEAIGLYKKSGYVLIPNYGQYENVATSVCFEKKF